MDLRREPACMKWSIPEPGVSIEEWQDGRCAACCAGCRGPVRTVLDHDHRTGLTRGYLCSGCNTSEGQSSTTRWRLWRAGMNPARLLDQAELYTGWGWTDGVRDVDRYYAPPTEVQRAEFRQVLARFGAEGEWTNPPAPAGAETGGAEG